MGSKDRIIVALDIDNLEQAKWLVEQLNPYVGHFKIGLELLTSVGAPKIIGWFIDNCFGGGPKLFFDGKFMDIPNTVAGASRAVAKLKVGMFNVHCLGGLAMMQAAIKARDEVLADHTQIVTPIKSKVLGVTLLTSLDIDDLMKLGFSGHHRSWDPGFDEAESYNKEYISFLCTNLAKLAKEAGLDGVISSPKEISRIRQECGPDFLIITPGVRPYWADTGDQKRVMTPGEAIKLGADYLVIGRPITKPPPEFGSPADAAKCIIEEIDKALA